MESQWLGVQRLDEREVPVVVLAVHLQTNGGSGGVVWHLAIVRQKRGHKRRQCRDDVHSRFPRLRCTQVFSSTILTQGVGAQWDAPPVTPLTRWVGSPAELNRSFGRSRVATVMALPSVKATLLPKGAVGEAVQERPSGENQCPETVELTQVAGTSRVYCACKNKRERLCVS